MKNLKMKNLKKTTTADLRWKEYIKVFAKAIWVFAKYFDKQVQDYIDYIENNPQMFSSIQELKKMTTEDLNNSIDDIIKVLVEWHIAWQKFAEKDIQKEITVWISFDITDENALEWANDNVWKLISWINETTQEEIMLLITNAIQDWKTIKETSALIKEKFTQYSEYRASLIATMEISNSFAEWRSTQFNKYEKYFWSEWFKRSQTQWDDKVRLEHVANQEEGRIPANQLFKATWTLHEPHWFNCRCVVAYRLTKPEN